MRLMHALCDLLQLKDHTRDAVLDQPSLTNKSISKLTLQGVLLGTIVEALGLHYRIH